MPDPTHALRARRAARAAQLRRRRKLAAGGTATLAIVAIAVVVVVASGGRSTTRRSATASGRRRVASVQRSAAGAGGPESDLADVGDDRIRRLTALGLPVYCGGAHGNEVAFTFDDGPGPYTHYAIKELKHAGAHATFFVVGRSMDHFPGWLPRELKVASIGDHTYHHPVLTDLPPVEVAKEIRDTREKIEGAIGQRIDLFRPPYGARDAMVDGVARRLGLLEILWTVDSGDSLGANWAGIIRNVEAGLHPGAIILMHENRGQTIRALRTLLPELHRRHLRSVSLPELFATDPPTAAQVRRGPLGCGQPVRLSSAAG